MIIIVSHENADFDAVAAQAGAHQLYPGSVPLLSRRVNRNVKQFMALYWDSLPFMRMEAWRRRQVDKVILVDTQSLPGVRGVREDTPVLVIDHHERGDLDAAWETHIEPVGAATTLVAEQLQASGHQLAQPEATLLLLGIYEDTGSLTYGTTTPRDVRAAAWLLEQEAQLEVVRRFLNIPLSAEQQELMQQLQANLVWLQPEGQRVVLATATAEDSFDDEISAVAHRLRDALPADGLILLVRLAQHVQLVARSTSNGVDVAAIARGLGGGGHSRAAAATIMDLSLEEAAARVRELLPDAVQPQTRVAAIMSRGVQTIAADATVADAARQMQRSGHEGYPVVEAESGKLVGLLTRRAVDRAASHNLHRLSVSQVMKSGSVTVNPTDSISRVQQLMIAEDWGQIPVVARDGDQERLLGIVTRTDLLRVLGQPPQDEAETDMRARLAEGLAPAVWQLVRTISDVAPSLNMPVYFVGGLVRDLLLRQPAVDVDMVVEGDAIVLASNLQKRYGGRVRSHSRFGTAKWLLSPAVWRALAPDATSEDGPEGAPATIDFVTARTEFYTRPTALPEVEQGSIKLDLHRRDFTINTLAIRLDGAHLGELLDFYNGLRDLEQGVIRVLHSLSFVDDPTRILRAVRLEQRLGFAIEARTAELIGDALPMLERVTGPRLRQEIELALREPVPEAVIGRLDELGVLAHIQAQLTWTPAMAQSFQALDWLLTAGTWREALQEESAAPVRFTLWLLPLDETVHSAVMSRLKVRKRTRDEVAGAARLVAALSALDSDARPSEVEKVVRPHRDRPRLLLVARAALAGEPAGALLDHYWREWRNVTTVIDGNDLRAAGLKPGPRYAILLDRLLAARLDGEVGSEAEERALLARLLDQPSTS